MAQVAPLCEANVVNENRFSDTRRLRNARQNRSRRVKGNAKKEKQERLAVGRDFQKSIGNG
jgi:hypothetical protein